MKQEALHWVFKELYGSRPCAEGLIENIHFRHRKERMQRHRDMDMPSPKMLINKPMAL